MLYPILLVATLLTAFHTTTASARMVPPWAKDLPNWKHYKIPQQQQNQARGDVVPQQSTLLPTSYDPQPQQPAAPAYDGPSSDDDDNKECPTICIDAINECGMRYGDCLPVCAGEKPELTVPPCPPAVTEEAMEGVIPESYLV